jgi:hypothetical protein
MRPGRGRLAGLACSGCDSGGCFNSRLDAGFTIPGQQLVDSLGRMVRQLFEHVGEPGTRIDIVELARLCRPPNYAERIGFPQHSS